jgi:hypothetical protein
MVKGILVSASDTSATLQLENGARTTVPITVLSKADQAYVQQQRASNANSGAALGAPADRPMTWPAEVIIDPKALNIVAGKQDAQARQYEYTSGSFQFISNAPLGSSAVKDIAVDFELMEAFFQQLPWGWQPKPKNGPYFRVLLPETKEDFVALGGIDNSTGGSRDDYIFKKLSAMGMTKVGNRYTLDPRQKEEGGVIGLTYRLLEGDMRAFTYPWTAMGMEELLHDVAYHKGTLRFSALEKPLKDWIDVEAKRSVTPDADRLISYLHMPWKDEHDNVVALRRQYYFDGLLLVYFFGFMDGDGKGTALHQYFAKVAEQGLARRAARESGNRVPAPPGTYTAPGDLITTLLGNRTDAQLREELIAKYRAIGVKL